MVWKWADTIGWSGSGPTLFTLELLNVLRVSVY
jgi:hypothetical protein